MNVIGICMITYVTVTSEWYMYEEDIHYIQSVTYVNYHTFIIYFWKPQEKNKLLIGPNTVGAASQ